MLGGIVHCATGHNPLRMQGKIRKGNTYYACGYRISYGDKAAHALGHGKWQYVREDRIADLFDRFFATHIFGPGRVARFKAQHADLVRELEDRDGDQRQRPASSRTSISASSASSQRSRPASTPCASAIASAPSKPSTRTSKRRSQNSTDDRHQRTGLDLDDACAVLDGLPNLREALAAADPKLRRQVYDAFRLSVEIDRNQAQIRLKALVSSAFMKATDLEGLVAHKAIAGERYALTGDLSVPVEWAAEWA